MTGIVITGATGFIGCRLAELWHAEGRDVRALGMVRNSVETKRAEALRKAGVPLEDRDLTATVTADDALDGADTVIHLAAAQHEANVDDSYFERVNVDATRNLIERSEQQGVKRFFYASSIGVYGINNRHGLDENTPVAADNPYGRSKVAAERLIAGIGSGMQLFIGRIGETYGPWDMRLHKLFAGIARKRFWLVGAGANLHQPIYVDDLAVTVDRLLETDEAQRRPVLLCGDRAVTTRQMCESIAASVGVPLSRWRIPMAPLTMAAAGMELTLGKAGIQPPLHRRRLDFFRKSLSFSTQLRNELLQLPPQLNFREGAQKTADWYRENGWL